MPEQKEIQQDKIQNRIAEAEKLLADKKVKLPDDILANAVKGLGDIKEKLKKRLPVYESDFDFVEESNEITRMGKQYNEAMENLKGGDLYNPEKPINGDKKAPTLEEVINTLRANLTPNQKEVIAQMKNPVFLVKPITTWKRFMANLNSVERVIDRFRASDDGSFVNVIGEEWADYERGSEITEMITGWEVGFAEGEQELKGESGHMGNLIKEWHEGSFFKKGARIITYNEYMLLMADSIHKNVPIDKKYTSMLRKEGGEVIYEGEENISTGRYTVHPDFQQWRVNDWYTDIHFRYAVMIKI